MANPSSVPWRLSGELPLHLEPDADSSVGALCEGLREHADWLRQSLLQYGAIRFRGFDVRAPEDFERIARCVNPALGKDYLGTSPRDAVTEYVFNASELPDFFPIAQHCEMSFCAQPPSHLFFCALVAPATGSGETPICDFRKVWRDLPEGLRERFLAGGIRHVRNYAAPGKRGDAVQLKSWDEMFQSQDHSIVEQKCRNEGFEPVWLEGDGLRLISTQPVFRTHPLTGEAAWHNHATTFHTTSAVGEYEQIVKLRPTDRHRSVLDMARTLEEQILAKPPDERSMHTTWVDGSEISREELEAVRDVIWQNTVIEPWLEGDVLAIDNFAVSHGRMPYEGPRRIVVCWA